MIGIYKITNKLTGKSYIGQSIHCGKRFDEHCNGDNQLIDQIIQIDGAENFTYEILEQVDKEHLSEKEDCYIMKYNTMYPNGYNKRWNCSKEKREILFNENNFKQTSSAHTINFVVNQTKLKDMAYGDSIYAWLLLRSHYNKNEDCNYIYKNEFTFKQIGQDIHKHKDTVSKRFKELMSTNIIQEYQHDGKTAYKMPHFKQFEVLDSSTVLGLITLPTQESGEELVKTYAYLLMKSREAYEQRKIDGVINPNGSFNISPSSLLKIFGHSIGNKQAYDRMRFIFTILQDAGIIEYNQIKLDKNVDGTIAPPHFFVKQVKQKAKDSWLGEHVNLNNTKKMLEKAI